MRQEKRTRRWPWIMVILVLLAIIAALGYGYWRQQQAESRLPILDTDDSGVSHVDDDTHIEPPVVENFTCDVAGTIETEAYALDDAYTRLMDDFMQAWYTPLAQFAEPEMDGFFTKSEDAAAHEAALRSLILIRQGALCDLRMEQVRYSLTVTEVEEDEEGFLRVEANETTTMRFAATPDTDSVLYDVPHIFTFDDRGETLTLYHHEADDNPYFSFTYEEGSTVDEKMERILRAIERRQLLRGEQTYVVLPCDHPYDRDAAYNYTMEYCHKRNDRWYAYDEVGGNCMNFGSQVLLAGGIPMDEQGDNEWYWHAQNDLDLSWINVGNFYDYARKNDGYGLVADTEAGYYTGEVGDILIVGFNGGHNHTTVITGFIYDKSGAVVDYLLSCNTTNYRNFPAGAYYYTSHRLIKIFGWNEG